MFFFMINKDKKLIKIKESDIQMSVVNVLTLLQEKYKFRFFHSPNEGNRKPQYQKKLIRMGMRSGCPDLVLEFQGGKIVCVELKTKSGSQSVPQKVWEKESKELGTPYFLIKGDIFSALRKITHIIKKYSLKKEQKDI